MSGTRPLRCYPANIGSADADNRIRLKLSDKSIVTVPIVFLNLTVRALAARAVKPHAKDVAVVCKKLTELVFVISIICGSAAVGFFVSVPRGQIHTEAERILAASLCDLLYNVAVSVFKRAVLNGIVRVLGRPKAKTVMMLAG